MKKSAILLSMLFLVLTSCFDPIRYPDPDPDPYIPSNGFSTSIIPEELYDNINYQFAVLENELQRSGYIFDYEDIQGAYISVTYRKGLSYYWFSYDRNTEYIFASGVEEWCKSGDMAFEIASTFANGGELLYSRNYWGYCDTEYRQREFNNRNKFLDYYNDYFYEIIAFGEEFSNNEEVSWSEFYNDPDPTLGAADWVAKTSVQTYSTGRPWSHRSAIANGLRSGEADGEPMLRGRVSDSVLSSDKVSTQRSSK